jgi:hypothetical protein
MVGLVWSCALGNRLELIQMKKMLLILMVLASVAHAQATMSDAEMTALIVGTWTFDCTYATSVYKSDGTIVYNIDGRDVVEKWWVKDGAFLETDSSIGRTTYYKILFLTEYEWLRYGLTSHAKGYVFLRREGRIYED